MKRHTLVTIFSLLAMTTSGSEGLAQGILKGSAGNVRPSPAALKQASGVSAGRRQDVEGTVWEFKVIDPKEKDDSKQTRMTGRIRIKQSSVFAVGRVKVSDDKEQGGENAGEDNAGQGGGDSGPRGRLQGLLSQRINDSKPQTAGGERIGDLSKAASSEYNFELDQDDEYPLSGLVKVRPDTEKRNGVWSGTYEEFSGGKKVKRWRFEMRKIEE